MSETDQDGNNQQRQTTATDIASSATQIRSNHCERTTAPFPAARKRSESAPTLILEHATLFLMAKLEAESVSSA